MSTYNMSEYPRYGEARRGAVAGVKHTELHTELCAKQHYTDCPPLSLHSSDNTPPHTPFPPPVSYSIAISRTC